MKAAVLVVITMVLFTGVAYVERPIYAHELDSGACPACTRKWEWVGGVYVKEYGDPSVVLVGHDRSICWYTVPGCAVASACVSADNDLFYPQGNCFSSGQASISHVVLCVECPEPEPTPIPEEEFVPEPGTLLLLASGMASLVGYGMLRRRRIE